MENPSRYLDALAKEFTRLPGIGAKSASRLACHILKMRDDDVFSLAGALIELKKNIVTCEVCGGISDSGICSICADKSRDISMLCVVENAKDIITIEAAGGFRGYYHVLSGLISPLDGIGPDELNISALIKRCASARPVEIILALNPTIEGDATSLYLAGLISPMSIAVSRIARGLPVGADLEYADSATIIKSIEGRVRM
ncbi:MAG: recombination mediator RecR [Spirochaetia bacterium]|nr:recombination mediator RecR [Spirochaetia bacterium]